MPIGKVKWFDADKGFGFVSNPGDEDVYVGRNVLPEGVDELVQGQRIDFDFAAGRRGPQALRVKVLDKPRRRTPSRKPDELSSMLSDVMTLLETQVQPVLAQGRYPERKTGRQVAEILRAIAKDLDS
ncbi:cold-shock protein [Corynebacterium sp. HMSC06D04]|uniref:Cold-shock protein n=2 Tax=Corynebacterium TaxID=1716 RepID=A0A2A4AIJ4_9CORY|nr:MULTISPECIES: cold shock domain-containing protein [Corynebacterium]MDU3175228.1 cold shock domain-containing protein [Corynebacterium striatum]PCC82299.1 cold-shock protein [Corynebacterium accolens]AMO88351.1 'Cold-shock' DNA-binding domain protein [Corynebacterium simulans]KXU18609.1 Cold-shock DNA-binding domain protein [Corynebacterium simulans]MCG7248465.1 cold shock domain-containing protein [Corynebacterium simulans]